MPKGVEKDQLGNSGTAQNLSTQNNNNAQNIYGSLVPQLTSQMIHPQGYTPTQKAAQNTAAQQSAGGSQAGAVGQGALLAARTRNAGTADAAIGQSARTAGQNLGNAAVGTEVRNAGLQNEQQQSAQHELGSIGSTDLGASLNALGLSNNALQGATTSSNANPWKQLGVTAGSDALKALFSGGQ